jgi:dipeptidyl aminopeptidase/acylaminoacyl peptidase
MRALVYAARDGQPIPSYLTLPVGPLSSDLPAIVMPHGGPETRDVRGFNPLVQFLAGQGYAILQPNFRGSLGFGAGFAAAGAGQWGGVIHNDITDGARWLIEQKIADAERVCIVGSSFGGYAALLAATRESQWYACAASFSGVSDLLALVQSAQRTDDTSLWQQRIGSDPRALLQMSPLSRVNLVEMPVLMMHGRSDAVVPVSQSRRFARSLRDEGKPHRFDERADCDHDMTVESCRTSFFETLAHFLAESLSESRPP